MARNPGRRSRDRLIVGIASWKPSHGAQRSCDEPSSLARPDASSLSSFAAGQILTHPSGLGIGRRRRVPCNGFQDVVMAFRGRMAA